MNKKDIKKWVKEAIEKKYDREDIMDLLDEQLEKKLITVESYKETLKVYDNELEEKEMMSMTFFQRRKIKKIIRVLRKIVKESSKVFDELSRETRKLTKKEKENVKILREKMILAIIGDKSKAKSGLNEIFEIDDGKEGGEITRETLEGMTNEEIESLLNELIDELEIQI